MVAYSFKRRFVEPIRRGLASAYPDAHGTHPKRQTIRAIGKRRHAKPGDELQLYHGMRTRECFLIGKARCRRVDSVAIDVGTSIIKLIEVNGKRLGRSARRSFAQRDGFVGPSDMWEFWRRNHGVGQFHGVLILWESL